MKGSIVHIGRYLLLNTIHLRCATAQLLERWAKLSLAEQPLAVASTQCGWFVDSRQQRPDRRAELPAELPTILAFARVHRCSYVLFDCDGPVERALPCFPW